MPSRKNRRVLVIDDNPNVLEDFRRILGDNVRDTDSLGLKESTLFGTSGEPALMEPFEVDCAMQGPEGVEIVCRAMADGLPITVAFVDVRMPPGWDGIETIEHIWRADHRVHVIICSAYSDHTAGDVVKRFGASDRLLLLRKPCDPAEILLAATAFNEKWNACYGANRCAAVAGQHAGSSYVG